VVEDRPIYVRKVMSLSSSLLLSAKIITHPAARSLCDSWSSCLLLFKVAKPEPERVRERADPKPRFGNSRSGLEGIVCA